MAWTEEEDKKMDSGKASDEPLLTDLDEKSVDESISDSYEESEQIVQHKNQHLDANKDAESNKLWSLLENVLTENVVEKRRTRRWRIFFRSVYLVFFIAIGVFFVGQSNIDNKDSKGDFVAVLPLEGQIGAGQPIDANIVLNLLDDAYAHSGIKALILKMNSPGGSPVHSGIIYDAIQIKKSQYPDIPIHVVVEDLAASGGYYIAAAADQIFVDKASLVGSIGVISAGFEATELLKKIGVERRIFTAGENKAFLDPFLPLEPASADKWQAVLDETHQQFIHAVKSGRGDRLQDHPDVFTGAVFSGVKAVEIGLADGLSSYHQLLNDNYADLRVVYFLKDKETWEKITQSFGASVVDTFLKQFLPK